MKKLKWEEIKDGVLHGILQSHYRCAVRVGSGRGRTIFLYVWKVGTTKWMYGGGSLDGWGATNSRAKAESLAVSTCVELCTRAVKALKDQPQSASR